MNPEVGHVGLLVCSQELGTGFYLESLHSIVHSPFLFLFNIPIHTWVFECSPSSDFLT